MRITQRTGGPGARIVADGFFPDARALRDTFEARFATPKQTDARRFIWDHWHVPGQYRLLRTPADQFFPAAQWKPFETALLTFARDTLGCRAMTPPWLSAYTDGCFQDLHADVPHGPWAYVFSLSPRDRWFLGGETQIARPELLDYWRSFDRFDGIERAQLMDLVTPEFNRLTVFDPRVPHGVTRVEGAVDVLSARLAIHGWFTDVRPHATGALSAKQVEKGLRAVGPLVQEVMRSGADARGIAVLRIAVAASGRVTQVTPQLESLVAPESLLPAIVGALNTLRFAAGSGPTVITLPLVFEAG